MIENREYASPELIVEPPTQITSQKRFPVFLGSDGQLFDLNYLPVSPKDWKVSNAASTNKEQTEGKKEENEPMDEESLRQKWSEFESNLQLFKSMPSPDPYEVIFIISPLRRLIYFVLNIRSTFNICLNIVLYVEKQREEKEKTKNIIFSNFTFFISHTLPLPIILYYRLFWSMRARCSNGKWQWSVR